MNYFGEYIDDTKRVLITEDNIDDMVEANEDWFFDMLYNDLGPAPELREDLS